jgi:signal transduction histidine kinase
MSPDITRSKRRARSQTALFLSCVAVPMFVIVALAVDAAIRYRARLVYGGDVQHIAEDLANSVEQQVNALASEALNDEAVAGLQAGSSLEQLHKTILKIYARHPIAHHLLLLENDRVVYPAAQMAFTNKRTWLASLGLDRRRVAEVARALRNAEEAESNKASLRSAVTAYERLAKQSLPASVRGWALFRAAACYRKLGQTETAAELYRRILTEYADEYKPDGSPLALSAGIALVDLNESVAPAAPEILTSLEKDLASDRWILSPSNNRRWIEEVAKLRSRAAADWVDGQPDLLEYTIALERPPANAQHQEVVLDEKSGATHTPVYSRAISQGDKRMQAYYALLPSAKGAVKRKLVLVPDARFIEEELIPKELSKLQVDRDVQVGFAPASSQLVDPERGVSVALPTILPDMRLAVTRLPRSTRTYFHLVDIALVAAAVLMMLLIGFVLRILHRDLSREREMNRQKSDFISGVSHDMKTPLTLIELFGETLLDSPEMSFAERTSLYSTIVQESERLLKLIESVLDYSRIQNSRKTYQLAAGNLARSVATTVELYHHYLERFGFSVSYQVILERQFPPVMFEAGAISSLVVNLLENAVKYSRDSKLIRVDMRTEGEFVCLEVEDYGIGIPLDEQPKIFDAFYRVNNKSGKGGCGLGLFLVKHIVEGHGGRIEVQSRPGRGTCFRISLPVAPESESASSPALVSLEEMHAENTAD